MAASALVRDIATGAVDLVSVGTGGEPVDDYVLIEAMSPDGRFQLWTSPATNLTPGEVDGETDLFLHDSSSGTTTKISVAIDGGPSSDATREGDLSDDGRTVVFASYADNLVSDDLNRDSDVFRYDVDTATLAMLSRQPDGQAAPGFSNSPSISGDGRLVAYAAQKPRKQVPGFRFGTRNVVVRNLDTGAAVVAAWDWRGQPASSPVALPRLSDTGYVVFTTSGSLHQDDPVGGFADVYGAALE
jgi:hypothetical protein